MFDFHLQNGKENLRLIRQVLDGPYDKIKLVGITRERFTEHLKAIRIEHVDAETDPVFWKQLVALEDGTSDRLTLIFEDKPVPDRLTSQLLDVLAPFNKNRRAG